MYSQMNLFVAKFIIIANMKLYMVTRYIQIEFEVYFFIFFIIIIYYLFL